jgi:hypothetical protein
MDEDIITNTMDEVPNILLYYHTLEPIHCSLWYRTPDMSDEARIGNSETGGLQTLGHGHCLSSIRLGDLQDPTDGGTDCTILLAI